MERRRVASLGRAYPLQGLLHCAGCGQRMRAVSMWRRRPDGSVAIYDSYAEWNRRIRGIECAAPQVQLTALIPDGQIRDILATIPIGRRVDDLDVDVGAPMAADLDRRRARLDERLRRANRMYEMGTIAEEEYEERVAGVRRERSQLEAAPSTVRRK